MSWESILKEDDDWEAHVSRRKEAQSEADMGNYTGAEHPDLFDYDLEDILWHLAELKERAQQGEGKDLDVVSMLQKIIQENESR